jgi:hypothetical protein
MSRLRSLSHSVAPGHQQVFPRHAQTHHKPTGLLQYIQETGQVIQTTLPPDQAVVLYDGSVPVVISLDSTFLLPIYPSLWSVMVSYSLCPPSIFPYVLCPLPIAFLWCLPVSFAL